METDFAAFRRDFFALVEKAENIAITSHFSPDDDSIGSVLSVYTILTTKYPNKNIRIIYTGNKVDRYVSFSHFDTIQFVPDVVNELDRVDLLIMLDGGTFKRFSKMPEQLQAKAPTTIVIDHHAGVPDQFTLSLILPTFSSNCEILFRAFDVEQMLTKELAESLFIGILSDTGNFSHITPEQSGVFLVAKILLEHIGVSIDTFRARYGGIPQRVIPLLQELVKNTTYVAVPGWPAAQYTYIDRLIMTEGHYTDEDMSTASHIYMGQYLPRVEGYRWGFVATPRIDGSCRMSSRSLANSVNVRQLHERLGVGSGHDRAAGADFKRENIDREPKQCIVEVLQWMEHNVPLVG